MSDKEKVSGEEVEVFYECREIGEGDWTPCDLRRYTYCQRQPEMDTRAFVPLYQHQRITEVLTFDGKRVSTWAAFWLFLAVFIVCDCWIFSQGYDSFFQSHKTEAEKEIQRIKIERLRERNQ